MAMFSPCVAFIVNTTRSGSASNSAPAASRQAYTASAARMAARCPPRPGLANARIAISARVYTAGGFGMEVAAASK